MTRTTRRRRPLVALASTVAAIASGACTYPATEVLVVLDTDFAQERPVQITAIMRRSGSTTASTRVWTRDPTGSLDAGAPITFPASFAIVPGEGEPRDGAIELEVEARLAPGSSGEPEAVARRVARFRFTPRQPTFVRMFMSSVCIARASGCATATGDACTVSRYCEDRGQTCGDDGACTGVDVVPIPTNGDVILRSDVAPQDRITDAVDAPSDVTPPDATDATDAIDRNAIDPPRFIGPVSGSNVSTQTVPRLEFEPAPGTNGAFIEVCADRACTAYTVRVDARNSPVNIGYPLEPGVWYWRATGGLDGVPGTRYGPTWQFHVGHRAATNSGWWGSRLDLNGDGYDDVVIGHPTFDTNRGIILGYNGGPTGLPASHLFNVSGEATGLHYGSAVAAAGDLDGDGFVDLAVGAIDSPDAVRIYRGSATGLLAPPVRMLRAPDVSASTFGATIAAAGDVNGDGYADLVVGAPGADGAAGRVFVYHGSATSVGAMPNAVLVAPAPGRFGAALASADVNGDHLSDLIVGAPDVGGSVGRVYVFHGRLAMGVATTPTTELGGRGVTNGFFGSTLDTSGDLNGDGFADVVTSAFGESGGQVYSFVGANRTGIQPVSGSNIAGVGGTMRLGSAVAGDADIDGDGFGDEIVGDPGTDRVLVFRGTNSGGSVVPAPWADLGAPAGGTGGFGAIVASGGDVDGDGFDDFVVVTSGATSDHAYLFRGASTLNAQPALEFDAPATGRDVIAGVGM